jgi:hypothetical protein
MATFPIVVNGGETIAPFGRLRIARLRVLRLLGSGDSDFNGLMSTRGVDAAACGVRGGWGAGPPAERFSVPRLNIPAGLSASGFALRTAGVFAA